MPDTDTYRELAKLRADLVTARQALVELDGEVEDMRIRLAEIARLAGETEADKPAEPDADHWLGVTGWVHADGTPCPEYLAPIVSSPSGWWCTSHQMYVRRPAGEADKPAQAARRPPMTGPARVRWRPGATGTNLLGYVGTLPFWTFQIFQPGDPEHGQYRLMAQLPGVGTAAARSNDPDELKGEAEGWLAGYVASIGAAFRDTTQPAQPAQPGNPYDWDEPDDYFDLKAENDFAADLGPEA